MCAVNQSRVRYERTDDQSYIVFLNEERIGRIVRMDDRQWHATTPSRLKRQFYTRGEAADWLRKVEKSE